MKEGRKGREEGRKEGGKNESMDSRLKFILLGRVLIGRMYRFGLDAGWVGNDCMDDRRMGSWEVGGWMTHCVSLSYLFLLSVNSTKEAIRPLRVMTHLEITP